MSKAFIDDLLLYEHLESVAIQAVIENLRLYGHHAQALALGNDGTNHLNHLQQLRLEYQISLEKCTSSLDEYVAMRDISSRLKSDIDGFDVAYPAVALTRTS